MSTNVLYEVIANVYDLLDIVYFRKYDRSPRKVVVDMIASTDRILDICTGTATTAVRIAQEKPDAKICGIDLSENMIRMAKKKIKKKWISNIHVQCMDATDLQFGEKCFDKVLISLVLHELEETLAEKILLEAKRVLKEHGEMIITEWEPSRDFWKRILFAPIHMLEPKPYRAFIKKNLYLYFERYGLTIVEEAHCDYTKVLRLRKSDHE